MPLSNFIWGRFEGAGSLRGSALASQHGRVGRDFVSELAQLFWSYAETSALEPVVALKATMLIPLLLLQKPSSLSKAKHNCKYPSQHLWTWLTEDLDSLVEEGQAIQHQYVHIEKTLGKI